MKTRYLPGNQQEPKVGGVLKKLKNMNTAPTTKNKPQKPDTFIVITLHYKLQWLPKQEASSGHSRFMKPNCLKTWKWNKDQSFPKRTRYLLIYYVFWCILLLLMSFVAFLSAIVLEGLAFPLQSLVPTLNTWSVFSFSIHCSAAQSNKHFYRHTQQLMTTMLPFNASTYHIQN